MIEHEAPEAGGRIALGLDEGIDQPFGPVEQMSNPSGRTPAGQSAAAEGGLTLTIGLLLSEEAVEPEGRATDAAGDRQVHAVEPAVGVEIRNLADRPLLGQSSNGLLTGRIAAFGVTGRL